MTQHSMTGIFKDLQANRQDKANANKPYVVVSLTKKGTPAQAHASDLPLNGCRSYEEAQQRKATMEAFNPGKTFVIITR